MPLTSTARRRGALGLCSAANGMLFLDVSTVNVALPSFQRGLGATPSDLAWILAGYLMAFGLALAPGGRLGDARGRRRVFVAGAACFGAASLLCGLAPSSSWLVAGRLLQGAAGGLLAPQLVGLLQQLFDGPARARALAVHSAVTAGATALGPVLGGLLIDLGGPDDGWRLAFLVNVPVVAVLLAGAPLLLPGRAGTGRRRSLDPVGSLLLAGAVAAVLLPLVEAGREVDGPPWWTVAGALLLVPFAWWERRHRAAGHEPLADPQVLRSPGFRPGLLVGGFYLAGSTGIFLVLAVFAQRGLGYTALQAGLAALPYALGSVTGALAGGRVAPRGNRAVIAGSAAMVLGLLGTAAVVRFTGGPLTGAWTAPSLLLAGLGSGLVITANQVLTLAHVPVGSGATAAALQQTVQRIGSAVGVAATAAVFFALLDAPAASDGGAAAAGLLTAAGFVGVALAAALLGPVRRAPAA